MCPPPLICCGRVGKGVEDRVRAAGADAPLTPFLAITGVSCGGGPEGTMLSQPLSPRRA